MAMRKYLWSFAILATSLRSAVSLAVFTSPSSSSSTITYTIGQKIDVSWQDANEYTQLSLGLFSLATNTEYWILSNAIAYPKNSYEFTIGLGASMSLAKGNLFAFELVNGSNSGMRALSPTFVIQEAASSTSSSTTMATSTTSSITTSATSTTTSSAATVETSTVPTSSGGLDTNAKIVIGIGIPIAFFLGVAAAAAAFFFHRRNKEKGQRMTAMPPSETHIQSQPESFVQGGEFVYYGRPRKTSDTSDIQNFEPNRWDNVQRYEAP